MKQHLIFIVILLLMMTLLPGCDAIQEDPGKTNEARIRIQEEYDSLLQASSEFYTMEDYAHYLLKWAAEKKVRASYDDTGNVIMSRTPSEGYSSQNSLNVSVPLNLKDIEKNGLAAATALTFLDTAAENNFMRLIFTNNEDPDHPGAAALNKRFLNAANHIILQWEDQGSGDELAIRTGGAGYSRYSITKDIKRIPATYPLAYTISITGLEGGDTSDLQSRKANPVKILGDLLARWKSEGILFELASFTGGVQEGRYPDSASLTVLLNENDVRRFLAAGEQAKKEFIDDFSDREPDARFLIEETPKPGMVLDPPSGDSIVSLMYTLVNGVVERDEDSGDILMFSQMEKVQTSDSLFILEIGGRFLEEDAHVHFSEMLGIIAGLSEVNHEQISVYPSWSTEESSPLMVSLKVAASQLGLEIQTYRDFHFDEASLFSRYENLGDVISIPFQDSNAETVLALLKEGVKIKEPPGDSSS